MTHSYPLASLYGNYLQSLAGIVFLGTPFYFSIGNVWLMPILGGLTALFVIFGIRTAIRHLSVIETTPESIAVVGPFGRRVAWSEITKVDLRFFATSRGKAEKGWMELKICDQAGCVKMESNLEGFEHIASKAANVGFRNGASMSQSTMENFTAMGVTVDFPDEEAG